jgi:hypothetical protein
VPTAFTEDKWLQAYDPASKVWWGDQTWEEMMFTGLLYSVDPQQPQQSAQ